MCFILNSCNKILKLSLQFCFKQVWEEPFASNSISYLLHRLCVDFVF